MNEIKDKTKIIDELLKELKEGKPEEEVKKKFELYFGKDELDSLYKKNADVLSCPDYILERNPLVYLAMENGAIRALKKNVLMDLNSEDEISKKMLPIEKERLLDIKKHYEKIRKTIFPFIGEHLKKEQSLTIQKEEKVISYLKGNLDREAFFEVLSLIEQNIIEENHLYLPYVEDNYELEEILYFFDEFKKIGTCLLREEILLESMHPTNFKKH